MGQPLVIMGDIAISSVESVVNCYGRGHFCDVFGSKFLHDGAMELP